MDHRQVSMIVGLSDPATDYAGELRTLNVSIGHGKHCTADVCKNWPGGHSSGIAAFVIGISPSVLR